MQLLILICAAPTLKSICFDDAVIAHQLAQVTERFLQTPDMMVEKSIIQDSVGRALVHANRLLLRTSLDRTFEAYPETSHTFDGVKF